MFTNGNIHFIIPHVNTGDLKSKKEKRKKKKSKRQKKDNEVNIY